MALYLPFDLTPELGLLRIPGEVEHLGSDELALGGLLGGCWAPERSSSQEKLGTGSTTLTCGKEPGMGDGVNNRPCLLMKAL